MLANIACPLDLAQQGAETVALLGLGGQTVCLLALETGKVAAFRRAARTLAERGVLTRVEAEPHL